MKQLVELQQHAKEFKKLNAKLVFVFREESEGVDGLKKIKAKHDTTYQLTLATKQSSQAYSSKRMTFDNYVISADGVIRGVVPGTLKDRATAVELMKILQAIPQTREIDE